jgi:primosomal protein N' (replication factor Y)
VEKTALDNPAARVLQVAIDVPLRTGFDYLPPRGMPAPSPGCRVAVRFGRTRKIGVVLATASDSALPASRLRRVESVLDAEPVLDRELLRLLRWAAAYYVHPPGEVCAAALPALIRQGRPADETRFALRLTAAGAAVAAEALARAPRQAALLATLRAGTRTEDDPALTAIGAGWRAVARRLQDKGWLERVEAPAGENEAGARRVAGPPLTADQAKAVAAISGALGRFETLLLDGVTGSGKTEVYLAAIEATLRRGGQALVLVPEIGLTPQLLRRFRARLETTVVAVHSGLTAGERLAAWRTARAGRAGVVIGTRSAVFTPLPDCGLIVVDEEHDPSLKQQDGFRYSARDVAVMRGQLAAVPVVLGSATPSLESLRNVELGRYRRLHLPERPGQAAHPEMRLIDLRVTPTRDGLTAPMLGAVRHHLDAGGQVMLFLNRRGFAPTLFCPGCGWTAGCPRCDARLTLHQQPNGLQCHHCGHRCPRPLRCPDCDGETVGAGQGTERIEEALARHFPDAPLARFDRDTIRNRSDLESVISGMRDGRIRILVGTQMLTKGHDFPEVSLVGVLNADQGLFGSDFRSDERLAQTILQVSGRAGRRDRPGEVLLQTSFPDHPLLTGLIAGGYERFAQRALEDRAAAGWPPYAYLALLRAEAVQRPQPLRFLEACAGLALDGLPPTVRVLGPAPSPMERRQGRYRAQLLLQARDRRALHGALPGLVERIESLPQARRVRWSLDVDPCELF